MSSFYNEEYPTCNSLQLSVGTNFAVTRFKKSDTPQVVSIDRSVLLFILSGKVSANCNQYKNKQHKTNEIALVPRNNCCYVRILEETTLISCPFLLDADFCNSFSYHELSNFIPEDSVYDFTILPTRERIIEFLNLLIHCLEDRIGDTYFHELMKKELFFFLRAYYSKEELATFFYPLLGKNMDFKELVMSNYLQIKDLSEFADKANMSLPTFKRHFQETFGQSAHKWITERKSEWIYKDILLTDMPISEIGEKYHFLSLPYFSVFCKKQFGLSPQKIRESRE